MLTWERLYQDRRLTMHHQQDRILTVVDKTRLDRNNCVVPETELQEGEEEEGGRRRVPTAGH